MSEILDDLDFSPESTLTGTWQQLALGFGVGVIGNALLWGGFFLAADSDLLEGYLRLKILKVAWLSYDYEMMYLIAWLVMAFGALLFSLIARAKRQPFKRLFACIIPYGLFTAIGLAIGKEIIAEGNGVMDAIDRIFNFGWSFLLLGSISCFLVVSIVFLLKNKYLQVALPLLLASLLVIGFVK